MFRISLICAVCNPAISLFLFFFYSLLDVIAATIAFSSKRQNKNKQKKTKKKTLPKNAKNVQFISSRACVYDEVWPRPAISCSSIEGTRRRKYISCYVQPAKEAIGWPKFVVLFWFCGNELAIGQWEPKARLPPPPTFFLCKDWYKREREREMLQKKKEEQTIRARAKMI